MSPIKQNKKKKLMEKSVLYIKTCSYLVTIPLIPSIGISKQNLLQSNLSKVDTYGTEVFVRFREVSALERFELESSQI